MIVAVIIMIVILEVCLEHKAPRCSLLRPEKALHGLDARAGVAQAAGCGLGRAATQVGRGRGTAHAQ